MPAPLIDYANIAEIDFAAKILDAFTEVQKVAQPENWDVLRPYAAKLLEQDLSATQDEADIAAFRKQLRDLFDGERDESQRVVTTAQRLFESLGTAPVYLTESQRIANLFATDLSTGDDIDRMLLALKVTFGYEAYEQGVAKPSELDDLANHFQRYRKLQKFLVYETDLRTADAYCKHPLPERAELRQARQYQRAVATKLNRLDPFVDEDVRLKTELVGSTPPQQGDGGTIKALVHEYTNVYVAFHDIVLERIEEERRAIRELIDGEELQAFRRLEQVTALQPAMADQLVREIEDIGRSMFTCLDPSKTSIIRSLATMPIHSCGLTFENGSEHLDVAQRASAEARQRFAAVLNSKFEVFTNPAVRERLEQGRNEPVVASILRCSTVAEVRAELVRLVATQPDIVETVNRYLKRIVVKRVRMSDFKPSLGTIQRNQIDEVAREFQRYLEDQLRTISTA